MLKVHADCIEALVVQAIGRPVVVVSRIQLILRALL